MGAVLGVIGLQRLRCDSVIKIYICEQGVKGWLFADSLWWCGLFTLLSKGRARETDGSQRWGGADDP